MAFTVTLKSGDKITLASAVREERDGSGVRFYDADGNGCGSFSDGQVLYSYPADSVIEAAPEIAAPSEEVTE